MPETKRTRNDEVVRLYGGGKTMQLVGDEMGISLSRVSQILISRGAVTRSTGSNDFAQRAWGYVDIRDPEECWPWKGCVSAQGYGRFTVGKKGKTRPAHRVIAELSGQIFKPGEVARHRCDVKICCNPEHTEPGTRADNVADRHRRGRDARGEKNGGAKMSELTAMAIIAAAGRMEQAGCGFTAELARSVASTHGVSANSVLLIARGTTWRYLPRGAE